MNNPLRFAGETFYQSGYDIDDSGAESHDAASRDQHRLDDSLRRLHAGRHRHARAVLDHAGALPAPARRRSRRAAAEPCSRKALRRQRRARGGQRPREPDLCRRGRRWSCGAWVLSSARQPRPARSSEMQLAEFGHLPLVYEGRVKPFDTAGPQHAAAALRTSRRSRRRARAGKTQPAIQWLLDVIAARRRARSSTRCSASRTSTCWTRWAWSARPGFRYSIDEFRTRSASSNEQAELAAGGSRPGQAEHSIRRRCSSWTRRFAC